MARLPWANRMAALASLGDEKRRQLFELVVSSPGAVGRDDVAQRAGIPRSTVSFHLDRLVQDGLLAVEFHKPPGKTGPGSGRPAKMYRPVAGEIGASVPDRNYDLAGELMAAAIEKSTAAGEPIDETLPAESWRLGRAMAEGAATIEDFLLQTGYRPEPDGDGGFLLPNCPFHRLSDKHPGVVCTMNGAFLQGAAARLDASGGRVVPADVPGHCCARITPPH
ncbi:putative ArsR family transcriptional regulator [Arthrobacter sp. SLBN-100]|uniref:helix-turn-helix transcriptional regulator n=1 Tax=Arthrobacter sp. SLBN-100 TaxID=2768450 RepID=UPI0011536984|nr:helix-turn-helix domain-containing protein [Arthrobacter sp. SLBN-100]TQJ67230.1 putative ArsR family transcriptional regulator [Arthrobacter sp. SLBN-100]